MFLAAAGSEPKRESVNKEINLIVENKATG
jgi:hypothetical protein